MCVCVRAGRRAYVCVCVSACSMTPLMNPSVIFQLKYGYVSLLSALFQLKL